MKNSEPLNIYSDYFLSAFGQMMGTGLAGLLGGSVSHDWIQQLLSQKSSSAADLWQVIKLCVRQISKSTW